MSRQLHSLKVSDLRPGDIVKYAEWRRTHDLQREYVYDLIGFDSFRFVGVSNGQGLFRSLSTGEVKAITTATLRRKFSVHRTT